MLTKKTKYILILTAILLPCILIGMLVSEKFAMKKADDALHTTKDSAGLMPLPAPSTLTPAPPDPVTTPVSLPVTSSPIFPESTDRGCDIVLLIDSSGSMKKTDPSNYRKSAAKLFISLLATDDRVAVMSFGDAAAMLIPLTQNIEQNRPALFNAVERISSKELSTNIYEAVRNGFDELKTSVRRSRILIVMSDGKLALGSKDKDDAALAELKALLPRLAEARIKLYAIAFTGESDRVLLEDMARATGGFFRFANADKDLHVMFEDIFDKIKALDAVPFEGDSFTTDGDIKEALVLVSKKPGAVVALAGPAGGEHTAANHARNIAWYQSTVFDMITISEPVVGTWRVKLNPNEGSRVYVLTELSLKSSFDRNFVGRGETVTIDAWLEKQGRTVTEKDVLDATSFEADLTGPDGKTATVRLAPGGAPGLSQPVTGKFSVNVSIDAAGEYTLKILAHGKTFTRERTVPFKAVESPVVSTADQTSAGAPLRVQAPSTQTFSWLNVLLRFGMVNLAAIGLAAAAFFIRMMLVKMRTRQ